MADDMNREDRSAAEAIKKGSLSGLKKGAASFVWLMKIMVPVSFFTVLLEWSGLLYRMEGLIGSLMGLLYLPSVAALPLLIGLFTGIYGAIAAMAVLPLSREQMTLIAIFLLIAHNLIQEGIIQGRSGLHPVKAVLFRIGAAVVTVIAVAQFLDTSAAVPAAVEGIRTDAPPFGLMFKTWIMNTLALGLKVLIIVVLVMILQEVFKMLGWINPLVRMTAPILRALGLNQKSGTLWMVAAVFGLAYGAAVIVEEAKTIDLEEHALQGLQLSIGINHSMIEDPSLFLTLGLGPFWLWIPRLITAIVAVRLLTLWQQWRGKEMD
jgi:hypothetical protein